MNPKPTSSNSLLLLRRLCWCAFALIAATLRASDPAPSSAETEHIIAAVRAADDERIAATKAGDRARMEAIYSDALQYQHASGHIDTKTSFVGAVTGGLMVYENVEFLKRQFVLAAPGAVVMTGRALMRVREAQGTDTADVIFLGVWHLEKGQWRFFAWQSALAATASK